MTDDLFSRYCPISKIDEEQHMVYGYATDETLDSQDEIVHWDATAEALDDYKEWRNIREMHEPKAVGTAPHLEMDDQGLFCGAHIVDDDAWKKVKSGTYKGFSIGGKYLDRTPEQDELLGKTIWHVNKYKLSEISLVDRPADPSATFVMVKRDIPMTMVESLIKAKITAMELKRKELGQSTTEFYAFPREKKLPIFDAAHVKNALARFDQTEGMTESEKNTAKRKIRASAKTHGVEVSKSHSVHGGESSMGKKISKAEEAEVDEKLKETKEEPTEKVEEKKEEEVAEKADVVKTDKIEKSDMMTISKSEYADLQKRVDKLEKGKDVEDVLVEKMAKAFGSALEKRGLVEKKDKAKELATKDTGEMFFESCTVAGEGK